jgi:hypothetical protein
MNTSSPHPRGGGGCFWIIDHDYEVDEDGDWWDGTENCMIFYADMWQYCGKRLVENQKWHADLLEEVEVC